MHFKIVSILHGVGGGGGWGVKRGILILALTKLLAIFQNL